ncbi:ATP synthase subunit C lysine N-methyltransferase-like [Phlebotomus argentipes]|uniref:ATP synthase subunit C lysine N-methyltransferase-like n=1 Tax=Phlebotomus argentipes TaxID=94469 RepID=UPI00289320FA|nr:ATP synthase subunit C lysine N-methyltransferase-like [Phlebotomus argentipes]
MSRETAKKSSNSVSGKILLAVTGGLGVAITCISIPFVAPAFRKICLPYVPATPAQITNVLTALQRAGGVPKPPRNLLLDIGSGDGRIVIAAAQNGYKSHGVELNRWLVHYSRFSAARAGVWRDVSFFRRDLWRFGISQYSHIVIFGVDCMMEELERKLLAEAQDKCTIVACRFPFPTLRPAHTIDAGIDSVWTYTIGS